MTESSTEHTCTVTADGKSVRWRLSVGPQESSTSRRAGTGLVSFQIVLELVEPEAETQLDFGF